jgi:hypothetical protein
MRVVHRRKARWRAMAQMNRKSTHIVLTHLRAGPGRDGGSRNWGREASRVCGVGVLDHAARQSNVWRGRSGCWAGVWNPDPNGVLMLVPCEEALAEGTCARVGVVRGGLLQQRDLTCELLCLRLGGPWWAAVNR